MFSCIIRPVIKVMNVPRSCSFLSNMKCAVVSMVIFTAEAINWQWKDNGMVWNFVWSLLTISDSSHSK